MSLIPINELKAISTAKEYGPMLECISENRPAAIRALQNFGKNKSQFIDVVLDNTAPLGGITKIRNMRQLLSDIEKIETSLEEAYDHRNQSLCKARMFREKAEQLNGAGELLRLKADQLESQVYRSENRIKGAIRKLTAKYEQYRQFEVQLKQELGKDEITEADVEADEEHFHITTAFHQALCDARADPNWKVHTGNFIYFFNLGINGGQAQADILAHLQFEADVMKNLPNAPPKDIHAAEVKFLHRMAEKYKGCASAFAESRGYDPRPSKIATLGYKG